MLPQRPTGAHASPPPSRESGPHTLPQSSFEAVKRRVLSKLEDRLDMSASKRMPQSLFRQSLRQHADQITEQEARGFAKPDRDRIVDDVLAELLGYGPLEELFSEAAVREVMVTGPAAVIVRREQGQWLPTSVKFRDEDHLRATLDRIATHADAVGPVMASMALFDVKLPNGFRAVALIPPEALGQAAMAAFVRERSIPVPAASALKEAATAPPVPAAASSSRATAGPSRSTSGTIPHGAARAVPAPSSPGLPSVSPRVPGSGLVHTPGPRGSGSAATDPFPSASGTGTATVDPLAKHRSRITERLLTKFASLKVYDLTRFDPNELRKVIGAYVSEYATTEKVYLSDTDQGRLTLEILTSLRR